MSDFEQTVQEPSGSLQTNNVLQETQQKICEEPQNQEENDDPVAQDEVSKSVVESSINNGISKQENEEPKARMNRSSISAVEVNDNNIDEIIDDMKDELEETEVKEDNKVLQESNMKVAVVEQNHENTTMNDSNEEKTNLSLINDTTVPPSNEINKTQEVVVVDKMQVEMESKESFFDRLMSKSGIIIIICVIIVAFTLVGISIGTNNSYDTSIGELIGYIVANAVISSILGFVVGIGCCIKSWTETFGQIIFWIIYLGNIINVFAMAPNVDTLFQILLILYGIIKSFVIPQARVTAKVDGSKLLPSLISEFINFKFYKESKLVVCYIFLIVTILVQTILISLASLAIVGDFNLLKLFALIFIVAVANIPRHFMTYFMANLIRYSVDDDIKQMPLPNNILKTVFNDCKNMLASIVLLSFFVDTSPIWISVANLMFTLQALSACMGLSGSSIAEHEEDENREGGCCWCCGCLFKCIGYIIFRISWLLENIAKFTLQYTGKTNLVGAGFENTTMIGIQKKTRKIIKEHKEIFGSGASKRMFLDDAMSQHITHLCILISSIFVWFIIDKGTGTIIIVWISGYAACRCIMEPNDTIIKEFLTAWYLKPSIIYSIKKLEQVFLVTVQQTLIAYGHEQAKVTQVEAQMTEVNVVGRLHNSHAGDVVTVNESNTKHTHIIVTNTNPNIAPVNGVRVQETHFSMAGTNNYQNGNNTRTVNVQQNNLYMQNQLQNSNYQPQPVQNYQLQQPYYTPPQQSNQIQPTNIDNSQSMNNNSPQVP